MDTTSSYKKLDVRALRKILWNLVLICVGSILCAVSINGILIPHQFFSAGFAGVALVIYYLVPSLSVSWLYFLLNIPLFALGWKYVGRRFFFYSLAGMVIFSLAVEWIQVFVPVQDKILSVLLAGIIMGTGGGIILRSLGSAGGLDILSVIMLQRFSVRLGSTSLAFNSVVLVAAAALFALERALYTLIYVYVTSYMLNLVVTGLSQRKAVFIISTKWKEVSHKIIHEMNRGLTIIAGRGGYTGKEEEIIYTVVAFHELAQLKGMIKRLDPNAFMVVSETLEVMGHRIGTQPRW
ncbi:MAG: YitT family protein [Desulfobacteraceae bacterium]